MPFVRRVIYYEAGERKIKDFPVKATRLSTGLSIRSEPYTELDTFIKSVDYKVSFIKEL